ncbi:MAG: hypothetical protein IJD27_00140 [Alistipes sp.]|nr:hypothetical protein [Alistipes sp.]
MMNNFKLSALAIILAIFSVQCSPNSGETPQYPTSIEDHFKAGTFIHEGTRLAYQEGEVLSTKSGKSPLVIMLHGQYANGSDNKSQLRHDAMIRLWHHLYSTNTKAVVLAPQCPAGRAWDEKEGEVQGVTMTQVLKELIDKLVVDNPKIDHSRIYIMGYSNNSAPAGAGGVWRLLSDNADLFAGAMVVAADPDNTISALNVAKTPILSVRGITDVHAVALTLDNFGEEVRNAGGTLREDIIEVRTREEVCREAFSAERVDWVFQFTK